MSSLHGADEVLVVGGGGEYDDGRPVRRVVQMRRPLRRLVS